MINTTVLFSFFFSHSSTA